ncbi:MAG: GH25 family lysozyme, partial [Polyangiaceae bacterium]
MRSRLQVGLAVGCAGVMAGCGGDDDFDPWSKLGEAELGVTVCADGPTIEGIDVAAYQPDTDWKKVADSGRRFAVIKATEGTGYVNSYFAQDWAGTKANGMVRGAYHYFRPDTDGVAQANHFLATVGALDGDELLMLDLETTDGQSGATVGKRAKDWMETVEAATGKKPIMYTGPNFWDAVIGAPAGFAEYPLWIAHYGVDCPLVPGDWGKWKFHQYTSTGQVPGINNPNCDRDVFNGTFEDLKAFAGGKPSSMTQVAGNDAVTLVTSPGEKKTWLFARTAGGELAVMSSAHGEKKWSEPALLGRGVACGLSAAFSEKPAPRGELVAAGEDGEALQAAWGADGWSEPVGFEGDGLAHPTTLSWPDGRIEAFAIDEAGQLQHRTSDAGTDVWSAWKALGDVKLATGVSVILRGDGRAQMFGTDGDGVGWHALSAETAGEWEEWKALDGEIASRPVPVRWPDGHLELFARDV